MANMESRKIRLTEDFHNTLNLMINAEDFEELNNKGTHILLVIEEMREVYSKHEMDKFIDEVVQTMARAFKRIMSVAE